MPPIRLDREATSSLITNLQPLHVTNRVRLHALCLFNCLLVFSKKAFVDALQICRVLIQGRERKTSRGVCVLDSLVFGAKYQVRFSGLLSPG
eukprot:evm.model.NODE_39783_length_39406_cov_27.122774.4